MESNAKQGSSLLTVKKILRVLSILLIIFVFCPSFLVSCSGKEVSVNVMTAVGGVKAYGENVTEPHPIMLICLIIPIVMLVVLFSKKILESKSALITLISAVIDFIVWLIFRSSVKEFADDNYCDFKTTGFYVFNIIVLILIVFITFMVVKKRLSFEQDLVQLFGGGGTRIAVNQMTNAVNQMTSAVSQMVGNVDSNTNNKPSIIGYCQMCGSAIPSDCRFCTSCGTPVPEELIKEAEEKKKVEEEVSIKAEDEATREAEESTSDTADERNSNTTEERVMFCQQCGKKLDSDAVFCDACGTKVE